MSAFNEQWFIWCVSRGNPANYLCAPFKRLALSVCDVCGDSYCAWKWEVELRVVWADAQAKWSLKKRQRERANYFSIYASQQVQVDIKDERKCDRFVLNHLPALLCSAEECQHWQWRTPTRCHGLFLRQAGDQEAARGNRCLKTLKGFFFSENNRWKKHDKV